MSKIEKDLGASSAYAYAVQYGEYTGTEEEYGQEMADLANISAEAETLSPDEEASASYSGGLLSFGIPQGVTGNGIASAVLNSDFTLTLTFTDGTTYTTPTPIKGETGAKGDTGATGATGNGIASITKTGTVGLVDTYTITFTDGTTTTFDVTNGTAAIDDTLSIAGRAADAKAVGDKTEEIASDINTIAPKVTSKNLYNAAVCNPRDGVLYNILNGAIEESANYAISGLIPAEPNTEYIFGTGGIAKEKHVICFGGENGETFLKRFTTDNASFVTVANTTFIGVNLFARTHTSAEFTSAIAVAQLEKGNVATDYVPYVDERKIPTNKLVDGNALSGVVNYTKNCSLINLYDKSIAVDKMYYNSSSHTVVSGNDNFTFSGYIPVKPNTQYNISRDKTLEFGELGSYYQEWDADKNLIQNTQQPYAMNYISQIQTGANTAYISINFWLEAHTAEQLDAFLNTIMLVEGCMRPLEYSAYNAEPAVNHDKIDIMRQINADRFRGKKWLATGTSVTYQDSKVYTEGVAEGELVRGYIGNVSRCKPMLIRNEGISGSTLADTTQNTALINRYQSLNFGSYDFITVEYGINDFGRNVPVGTAQDAAGTSTFAACLKTIIEYALTQNPIVGLIICTDPDVRGATTNQNGNTLKDYADVTLEIASQYRLPVCDWFYHSGINAITKGDGSSRYFLTQSGTHPSVYGHMRMGAMLNQVFDSLIC